MRIVVGVDRSEASRAALSFAMQEAAARSAELVVIHAWQPAFEYVYPTDTTEILRDAGLQQANELLERVLEQGRAEATRPVENIIVSPVEGDPAEVLVAAVREGDLLVVGANQGGPVRRLMLGSVSSKVVNSARTPVVVVPAPRPSEFVPRQPMGAGTRRRVASR